MNKGEFSCLHPFICYTDRLDKADLLHLLGPEDLGS